MRKLVYWLPLPLVVTAGACSGKKGPSGNTSTSAMTDSVDTHGLQRIQMSKSEADSKFREGGYHSPVLHTPNGDLPHVTNELGNTYVDNRIISHPTCDNGTVLNRVFTRNDFSSVIDTNFLSKSILEDVVYDKTAPQGIVYTTSVCYPQTDLYIPLSITITTNGEMSVQKVDILEGDYGDEAPD